MSCVQLTISERVKIEAYLELDFSIRKIAESLFQEEKLSFKTIYRWIYADLVEVDSGLLRQKGKHQKPRETSRCFNIGLSISKRPSDVKKAPNAQTSGAKYRRLRQKGNPRPMSRRS